MYILVRTYVLACTYVWITQFYLLRVFFDVNTILLLKPMVNKQIKIFRARNFNISKKEEKLDQADE